MFLNFVVWKPCIHASWVSDKQKQSILDAFGTLEMLTGGALGKHIRIEFTDK